MGYAHTFQDLLPSEQLAEIAAAVIEASPVRICGGPDGEHDDPVIEADYINFNGCGADGEDCEEFLLDGALDGYSQYCKTARKPYDEVVVAVLVGAIVQGCEGAESIRSDGDIGNWARGIELYEECFGRLSDDEFAAVSDHVWPLSVYDEESGEWREYAHLSCRDELDEVSL